MTYLDAALDRTSLIAEAGSSEPAHLLALEERIELENLRALRAQALFVNLSAVDGLKDIGQSADWNVKFLWQQLTHEQRPGFVRYLELALRSAQGLLAAEQVVEARGRIAQIALDHAAAGEARKRAREATLPTLAELEGLL